MIYRLILGIESLDIRSPAVALPAEQYFADTAAKISPERTLPPRYARCSGSGVRARAFSSGCPNVLRDMTPVLRLAVSFAV